MKNAFVCSLVHSGLVGGMLYLDDHCLTYRCNKVTISEKYRHLIVSRLEIKEITWNNLIASVFMNYGEIYKFLIFNKSKFVKAYENK